MALKSLLFFVKTIPHELMDYIIKVKCFLLLLAFIDKTLKIEFQSSAIVLKTPDIRQQVAVKADILSHEIFKMLETHDFNLTRLR